MFNQSEERDWKSVASDAYSYARRCGASQHDAEDHAQEFVRAKLSQECRRGRAKPIASEVSNALVYTSVRHEIARASRKQGKERQMRTSAPTSTQVECGQCERRMSVEVDVLIEQVLGQLRASRNPHDAEVLTIIRCMMDDMSIKEMAEWMGCSKRTAYRMLERASARVSQVVHDVATVMGLDDLPREIKNAVLAIRAGKH